MALSKNPSLVVAFGVAYGFALAMIVASFFFFGYASRDSVDRLMYPILPALVSLIAVGTCLPIVLRPSLLQSANGTPDTAEAQLSRLLLTRYAKDQTVFGLSLALVIVALLLSPLPTPIAKIVCTCYCAAGTCTIALRVWAIRRRQRL